MSVKVLIVDDSALMRKLFTELFEKEGFIVRVARNGEEALTKAVEFEPDCITLDINMPVMDGMTCLAMLKKLYTCPIIMVSSLTQKGATITLEALALGASDFVLKTGGTVSRDISDLEIPLINKIHALTKTGKPQRPTTKTPPVVKQKVVRSNKNVPFEVVLVGVSTGGPKKLEHLVANLSSSFPAPVVISQHMPASFTNALAKRLDGLSPLSVVEVDSKMPMKPGTVYLAKGDADLAFSKVGKDVFARPVPSSPSFLWHPSIDRMVDSALTCYKPLSMLCVQLTGMGCDGVAAMSKAFKEGATTIAESEATSVVFGMPKELIEAGCASFVLDSPKVASKLNALCR
ncbi:chemotaxis protein CheB [Alteromonas mediterranea]|uniref:Protein-glutamate methylesterase/protein-glutamine glutaminase n=1 Tax=Alteromonas mediterranea (strain DSM 17117 / CIP 110805 / LMG 28347 / Deep ecotype) TaxID=1774373 RepID=F2GD05_ALTMD|nr:chemotaxis protein CheB [Alteromonas mediterranea]AEA99152.1 chemotaxis protein CheB [Alteromonas mediterranea DE]CAH1208741.1 Chemotaxis response regulator protein-glutamate methylesterase [Alteromonas mediterranea]